MTQTDFPESWANIQVLLGDAYEKRIQDERTENLEQASVCYRKALQVYTQEAYPEHWATIQKKLESFVQQNFEADN